MKFRLGYVAMTMNLENCTPSGTVTYAVYSRLESEEARHARLLRASRQNLENTLRILKYNLALGIDVYRLTSKLIPLATHKELSAWDYKSELKEYFLQVGNFIRQYDFRISAHPDHFTLLNPINENVLTDSIRDLDYHVNVYEAMGLYDYKYKLVLHVGGLYGDKSKSIERFMNNFIKLPERIRNRIILENDDKSYTAADVLEICEQLDIPMVLDVHHHNCNNNGENLMDILPRVFDTWKRETDVPKLHFSSSKSCSDVRSHSDYINFDDFISFIKTSATINRDIDIMIEAKMKDNALFDLSEKLSKIPEIKKISNAKFMIYPTSNEMMSEN